MSNLIQKRFLGTRRMPRLSVNYGTRLIESELDLEHHCTLDNINKLVQLYTEAIEFYSYQKDSKALDFQNRMHRMFLRPDVIQVMKSKSAPEPSSALSNSKTEEKKINAPVLPNEPREKGMPQQASKSVNRVIDYQKLRNIEVAKKAADDFKFQDIDLSKRLASRQKVMFTRSMDTRSMDTTKSNNTSMYREGHSVLGKISEDIELKTLDTSDFDQKLEELMEKNFTEKAHKLAEVRVKYETQMTLFEGQGNLMAKVLEKLKHDMNVELSKIEAESELSLRKEIESFHKLYY